MDTYTFMIWAPPAREQLVALVVAIAPHGHVPPH